MEVPEFHQTGNLTLENVDLFFVGVSNQITGLREPVDVGLQVAKDGRIWLCINGIAFLRFSPHPNGKMAPPARMPSDEALEASYAMYEGDGA